MSQKSNQRADVKNPNNPAHKVAQNNRANQLNPNHLATKTEQVIPVVPETGTTGSQK